MLVADVARSCATDGSSLVLTGAERRSCTKLAQNDMHVQGQLCILCTEGIALVTYQISSRLKLGAFDVQFGRWMVDGPVGPLPRSTPSSLPALGVNFPLSSPATLCRPCTARSAQT